jgi:hypothetical protein
MRHYATDFCLWGLISGCLFSPIAVVWMVSEGVGRIDRFIEDVAILGVACGAAGWLLHAVAVVCGVRLSGSADPAQAADYDDAPPSPPTA